MLTTGLVLAGLTVGGFYMIYRKLPNKVKQFFINRPLFTDAVGACFTYVLFAGTAVGIMAAAWAGLILSFMIAARKNPFIMGWVQTAKEKLTDLFKWIETVGIQKEERDETINKDLHPIPAQLD